MTAPRAELSDRGTGAPRSKPTAIPALAVVLLAGLGLRLIIAYVLLPNSGFGTDIASFTSWALTLAEGGPGDFYAGAGFADYPPGYLYILWLVGELATLIGGPSGAAGVATALVKVPPVLADLGVGWLLWDTLRTWIGGRRGTRLGVLAASLYLFNPVTVYDSAIWGQVDAVGALVMLGAVRLLVSGWSEGAALLTVLAALVKPQFGIVLAPIVGAVLLRRHLLSPGSGPRPHGTPERLTAWFSEEQGIARFVSSAAVGIAALVIALVPFGLDLVGYIQLMAQTAGGYPFLSVNAYNPWALVAAPANARSLAEGGGWSPDVAGTNPYGQTFAPEDVGLLFGLPGVTIGTVLLAAGFLVGVIGLLVRSDRRSIVLVAVYLSLAFFILPTRVHERYLFPVFAFLPLLAAVDRRWLLAGGALALFSFVNLHGVLTTPVYGTPNVSSLPLGEEFRTPLWIAISAAGHGGVFLYALLSLRPLFDRLRAPLAARNREGGSAAAAPADASPAPEGSHTDTRAADIPGFPSTEATIAATAPPPGAVADEPWWRDEAPILRRDSRPTTSLATRVGASGAGGTAAAFAPRAASAWRSAGAARPFGVLRRALAVPAVRRDRTASLFGEGGGRFTRLDLFVLALVVVAALSLRTWRLAEPYGMHFDEVYHARTATEFLQHWRYGLRHDIYEFTHPHLAKYLIAAGIVTAGNNRVTGEADLGTSVVDALVERRWTSGDGSGGDRLWVADGAGDVRGWSLADRTPLSAGLALTTGAISLALDPEAHVLYGADAAGIVWSSSLAAPAQADPARLVGELGGRPIDLLAAGSMLTAVLDGGRVVSLDTATGERIEEELPGATALATLDGFDRLVAEPAAVDDPAAVASRLAELIDDDATRIEAILTRDEPSVTVVDRVDADERGDVEGAIANGELPGLDLQREGTVAVAYRDGVAILEAATLAEVDDIALGAPATGMALVEGVGEPTLYVAAGPEVEFVQVPDDGEARRSGGLEMPGAARDVRWDEATQLVHVLGVAPDGTGDSVYVIEPHGNAVFADARLPFSPAAWDIDEQPEAPSVDRQELLALAADGRVAVVDAGSTAFGWRIPGVLAGVAMTALLYVLARILFARREVALLVAGIAILDGMFFAQSRIAMNDSFVGLFIVAAYTVFAALHLGRWRGASGLLFGIPLVGVLLGLALASKWVGAYAMGGIVLLILLRSALGRLLALGGMIAATGVLGWLAIVPPDTPNPQTNFLFLFLMIALTILLAAAIVARPIRMSIDEARFAVGAPAVLGVLIALVGVVVGPGLPADSSLSSRTLIGAGVGLLLVSAAVYAALAVLGRYAVGPLATRKPDTDTAPLLDPPGEPPTGWLRPGWRLGIPWLFALACLTVIPLAVYVVSYVPWAALGNRFIEGFPAGNTGQLFVDLQRSMYDYHNNLRATHAASSPWWAWLFDLKPVWFYSEGLANDTTGLIYDAGNLVLFWLSAAALPWAAWQAWRRRSLTLGLVVLAFACQWLPWARIDRATFQYHVYTSLPFAFLVLAYFLADLWHGPSRRTWLYARVVAAVAIMGPALLWLARAPLCAVSGVDRANPGSEACGAVRGQLVITERVVATLVILLIGALALAWQWRTARARSAAAVGEAPGEEGTDGSTAGERLLRGVWMAATVALTAIALVLAQTRFGDGTLWAITVGAVGPYVFAAVVLVPLLLVAWVALNARDSRRYVVSAIVAAALWLVVFYPHISGLPMPNPFGQAYLGVLPTWNYDFQFAVNTDDPVADVRILGPESLALGGGVALLTAVVMYAVWSWRLELAARRTRLRSSPVGGK